MIRLDRHHLPAGWVRALLRLPVYLYHMRLGWLLGRRFLLLKHRGRQSGRIRETVLEVVRYEPGDGSYIIASGWGAKANWFQNVKQHPAVEIMVGCQRIHVIAHQLTERESESEFRDSARRHPHAFRKLAAFMLGHEFSAADADFVALSKSVPMLALLPTAKPGSLLAAGTE
jgi:deazaflavin-dependent oxidoreductase (nitroreductase family)